jgi:tetratricopeptide (TPR) repeat protein
MESKGKMRQRNYAILSQVVAISVLVLSAGGLYLNSIGNLFTNWDDGMIYNNQKIRDLGWENVVTIFTPARGATYQPIRVLSYALDYHFWKLNPTGYHVTNILFYILTCIMVFLVLRLLSAKLRKESSLDSHKRVATFGALLFAAHPVHVEAVTWLAARKEVLQGFFFFLAFYFYLKGRDDETSKKTVYLSIVLVSFLLAVLSKSSAVVFPGVIILYELTRGKEKLASFIKEHSVFIVAALVLSGIFTFIMMKVMFEAGGIKHYHGFSVFSNILVTIYAFLRNAKLLIFAGNYSPAYQFLVNMPFFCMKNILLILITLVLFVLSFVSLKWTKVILFSFFFFLINLLPYLNIIPISTLLADRYVFIASFSYCFVLGVLFDYVYRYRLKRFSDGFFKLLSISVFLLLLTGYSFMTIQQNKIWENSFTLWSHAVENNPESSTANAMMGVVCMDLQMDEEAIKYLEKAVRLLPYDYLSRNNLGIVYGRLNEPEKALKELMTAILLKPDDVSIKINLSVFYLRQKEYKKAEGILKNLLSKTPQDASLHFRLGLIYKDAGRYKEAVSEFLRSVGMRNWGISMQVSLEIWGKPSIIMLRGSKLCPKPNPELKI